MKRILLSFLIVIILHPSLGYAAGLRIDFSRYTNYTTHDIKGLKFVLHESFLKYKEGSKVQECTQYWRDIFSIVEKICPRTAASFRNNNYKIYLYHLPISRGGMEFFRPNQHRWDKRINSHVDKGIAVPSAYSYMAAPANKPTRKSITVPILIHELAHYRHVVLLKNNKIYNNKIKRAYNNAMRNIPTYKGSYASRNDLEYFAEISMSYLLLNHAMAVFPDGSKTLHDTDRIGYNLCKEIWGENLAAWNPSMRVPLPPKNPLMPVPTLPPRELIAAATKKKRRVQTQPVRTMKGVGGLPVVAKNWGLRNPLPPVKLTVMVDPRTGLPVIPVGAYNIPYPVMPPASQRHILFRDRLMGHALLKLK